MMTLEVRTATARRRGSARRWMACTAGLAVVLGLAVSSAPPATANGVDLVAQLPGVAPRSLSLSASRATGVDVRDGGTAWSRDLGTFGAEQILREGARQALASVGRTAVNSSTGLILRDQGRTVAKLAAWSRIDELSGPYLLGRKGSKDYRLTVLDGTRKVAFGSHAYPRALFGSLVAAIDASAPTWRLKVYDVASGTPVEVASVSLAAFTDVTSVCLWGDTAAVSGSIGGAGSVKDFQIIDLSSATPSVSTFTDQGQVEVLGDGVGIVKGAGTGWQLLNVATSTLAPFTGADDSVRPAVEAGGHVLYNTATDLVVHQIPFAGTSAPRALWVSATSPYNSWSGETASWQFALDATKPLQSGSLTLTGKGTAAGASKTLLLGPANDGSLRLAWNGRLDDGTPAPAGEYDWALQGPSGVLAVDGDALGGTITVTNKPATYPQETPVIGNTTPVTGSVLNVETGPGPSDGDDPTFRWYRGTKAIPGATGSSYVVAAADVGKKLKVKVSFAGSVHYADSSRFSAPTAKVAKGRLTVGTVDLGDPAPKVDTPVDAVLDGWAPEPFTKRYVWLRVNAKGVGTLIPKASGASYTPTPADKGFGLRVVVTGSRAGYRGGTATSLTSPPVAAGVFGAPPTPQIAGTSRVDMTLTAVPGAYVNADGQPVTPTFRYQWLRVDGAVASPIPGATGASYTATPDDEGLRLAVTVVARRATYAEVSSTSDPYDIVAAPMTPGTVTISDTSPTVGDTLTASPGSWLPDVTEFAYQWYRGTAKISGATSATYTVKAADRASKLRVRVVGAANEYASVTAWSDYTAAVAAA